MPLCARSTEKEEIIFCCFFYLRFGIITNLNQRWSVLSPTIHKSNNSINTNQLISNSNSNSEHRRVALPIEVASRRALCLHSYQLRPSCCFRQLLLHIKGHGGEVRKPLFEAGSSLRE